MSSYWIAYITIVLADFKDILFAILPHYLPGLALCVAVHQSQMV